MVGADGEVGRRRPRLDLLVRAIEEWESILSGGMELDGTLLARLEKMVRFNDLLHPVSSLQPRCRRSPMRLPSSQTNFSPYIPLSAGSGEKRAATTRYLSMARSAGGASGSVPSGCMTRIIARPWRSSTIGFSLQRKISKRTNSRIAEAFERPAEETKGCASESGMPDDHRLVTPHLLTWARQRRGLEVEDLAKKLNVKPDAVNAWEAGAPVRRPTFRQAQNFAQASYVPFGYLYLADPPVQELPLPDFRTIPGQPRREPSLDLLALMSDVLGKQQWFLEYRESEGIEELPFVGSFGPTDPVTEVAGNIREVIDVDGARQRASNWEGFMRELTRNAEQSGIMIMRSGVVGNNTHRPLDVEEFRGFSVSDHVAPLIFINGQDFRGAQIFTLAHEMAHIWAGQGGLSNLVGRPTSHLCPTI